MSFAIITLVGAAACGFFAVVGFLFPGVFRQTSRNAAFVKFAVIGLFLFGITIVVSPDKNNDTTVDLKLPAPNLTSLLSKDG